MHQYKIIYTDYSPEGAPTNNRHIVYADTAEQAQTKFDELNALYRTHENADGETVKYKAYKVSLQVAAYKPIENPVGFFQQFQI